ncbi:MAG: L,D-transpeptidase family protein [Oligoflexia bacterium]|nr:L,D-transpeptidase family protein [Oligoflexia bacterium]
MKILGTAFVSALGAMSLFLGLSAQAAEPFIPTAILVDKATNTLRVTHYVDGAYQTIKTYHTTLGQVKGDKEDEGDMKTPEGIYDFKALLRPPALAPQFGKMAFYISFPNTYDQLAGRTGSNIMLHATNTPDRLNKDYDSLGCVVVRNEEIDEIRPYVKLGLTPILIFNQLTDEYLSPGRDPKMKEFFQSWIKSWEGKDIDAYIDHYHSDFSAKGMSKAQWKKYKTGLNKQYASIEINPESVLYYEHPKYSMITFTQNYRSKLRSGAWGHRSRGTKILYIAEEGGKPKIIAETYTTLMW